MDKFEALYQEYVLDIYHFCLSLCGNELLAEDITQETFFKALQNIDRFRGECSVKTWLFRIAQNEWITRCRKNKKLTSLEGQPEPSGEGDLETSFADRDTARALHKKLHHLQEPYKEVFTLRVFGELPFAQIAELFGKSESWAKMTYYRAKQKLRGDLE